MFNYIPDTPGEQVEFDSLQAQQWQINALRYNPDYTGGWGPGFENYIRRNISFTSWKEFKQHDWTLCKYNHLINFYFFINDKISTVTYRNETYLGVVFWFVQPRKG